MDLSRPGVPRPDLRAGHGPGRLHVLDRPRPGQASSSVLFAKGQIGRRGRSFKPETLEKMWKPQFVKPGDEDRLRHRLHAQPVRGPTAHRPRRGDLRLRHRPGGAARREARRGRHRVMRLRQRRDPTTSPTTPCATCSRSSTRSRCRSHRADRCPSTERRVRAWPAATRARVETFELIASAGRLFYLPGRGGFRMELRQTGDDLESDDRLGMGLKIHPDGKDLAHRQANVHARRREHAVRTSVRSGVG